MSAPLLPAPGNTRLIDRLSWPDLIAGLSLAGLLLPEAVAYSSIANLPPQAGVIALFAGLLCYGLMGTSRFAIVSATSSSAAVLALGAACQSVSTHALDLRKTATAEGDNVAVGLFQLGGRCEVQIADGGCGIFPQHFLQTHIT